MSKKCPLCGVAIYADCLECETKLCKKERSKQMYNKMVIGIDQSYNNTGISICCDGQLKKISSLHLDKCSCNSERRLLLKSKLESIIGLNVNKAKHMQIICERIRLQSQGFININYIKSIGALNATIVDVSAAFDIKTYSVDTRSWKSNVVGTSKPQKNPYGVAEEKWPTIKYLIDKGYQKDLLIEVLKQKKKGVVVINGVRYIYNDDAADSACIALYGFIPESKQLLEEEH